MYRSSLRTLMAAVAVTSAVIVTAPSAAADDTVTIDIVAFSDFHGHLDETVVQWAATIENLRAEAPSGGSLLVAAGDNVGESLPASAAQYDNPTIDVLNLLEVDASAVGNHEFDAGRADLFDRIIPRSAYPILGANVRHSDGTAAMDASMTTVVSGLRVAVIGAVTADTPNLVSPGAVEGLIFGDPVAAVNAEAERLSALPAGERPDVIVAAFHEGAPWGSWSLQHALDNSAAFASIVEGTSIEVDAIITGHGHAGYAFDAPVPGEEGRSRPVVQSAHDGQNVGRITLTVDPDGGEVTDHTVSVVDRIGTPEADLIASSDTLAQIAQIRDDAVAFAERAEDAKVEYDDAIAEGDAAYAAAGEVAEEYRGVLTEGMAVYGEALEVKADYDAAVAASQQALTRAVEIKAEYDAAMAAGRAAYDAAAAIKAEYDAAVAEGRSAYASAATIKAEYDAAMAASQQAYARAASIKTEYDAAVSAGREAYAEAAALKAEYEAALAAGGTGSELTELVDAYLTAAQRGADAYALAASLKADLDAAVADGVADRAAADALKADLDAALAEGAAAYARATSLKADLDAALAEGAASYATAASLKVDLDAALAERSDALGLAASLKEVLDPLVGTVVEVLGRLTSLTEEYIDLVTIGNAAYALAASLLDVIGGLFGR